MLAFERDLAAGEKICRALEGRYKPALEIYGEGGIGVVLKDYDLVVAVMAVGIVVRSLCGRLKDKWTDTPVLAVDSALKCAVPVIGGHHGANGLAVYLGERLGLYPAVTTATDASGRSSLEGTAAMLGAQVVNRDSSKEVNLAYLREDVPVIRLKGPKVVLVDNDVAVLKMAGLVVGVGARRGVRAEEVLAAVDSALEAAGRSRDEISVMATAWIKRDEPGIKEAASALGKEVVYLPDDVLNAQTPTTPSRASDLGLSGVAEPAVLALASRLISPKKAYGRVTVALGE